MHMALYDKWNDKELKEVAEALMIEDKPTRGRALRAVRAKYGINNWYLYKTKEDILSKYLGGFKPTMAVTAGTSTLLDGKGNVKLQWIKEVKHDKADAIKEAILDLLGTVRVGHITKPMVVNTNKDLLPVYISNDVHIGALMWGAETRDSDWDLSTAEYQLKLAIDELVERAPSTEECIVVDLGDLTEIDDLKNMTPKSGHILDTDGRYPKVMKVAMECMRYFVERALTKHNTVRFINISGNHDITTGYAITAFMSAWFRNDDRVVIDESPSKQKYYQFGRTLLGFAHGDGLKMGHSGEVMAMHNEANWSTTKERYYHFGHIHKDAIYDGRLCKAESHRNIAPLNAWAADAGFGRNAGTMKCIVYDKEFGEDTRITYNVRRGG